MIIMNKVTAPMTMSGDVKLTMTQTGLSLTPDGIKILSMNFNISGNAAGDGTMTGRPSYGAVTIVRADAKSRVQAKQAVSNSHVFPTLEFFFTGNHANQHYCYRYIKLLNAFFTDEHSAITSEDTAPAGAHHNIRFEGMSTQTFTMSDAGVVGTGPILSVGIAKAAITTAILSRL